MNRVVVGRLARFAMLLLACGHVQIDAMDCFDLFRIPKATIRADRLRLGSHVPFHLLQHRYQLVIVSGLLNDIDGHDHLRLAVYGGLRVVALEKSTLLTSAGA